MPRLVSYLLLSLLPLLSACSSARKESYTITPDSEKRMAQEALPKIRRDFPALRDEEIQSYVSTLGQKIVQANQLEGNPYSYSFLVVDSPMVNAFALPAGHIFVSVGLLQFVESEAELAGVLSHEMGHVQERHSASRFMAQRWSLENSYWMYGGAGVVVGALASYGASRAICLQGDLSCVSRMLSLGAVSGFAGGLAVQKYIFLYNSRENELQADRLGFQAATRAGFAAEHVADFYERLAPREKRKGTNTLFDDALETHPTSAERVKRFRELRDNVQGNATATIHSPEFLQMRQRVLALKLTGAIDAEPKN